MWLSSLYRVQCFMLEFQVLTFKSLYDYLTLLTVSCINGVYFQSYAISCFPYDYLVVNLKISYMYDDWIFLNNSPPLNFQFECVFLGKSSKCHSYLKLIWTVKKNTSKQTVNLKSEIFVFRFIELCVDNMVVTN